MGRERRGTCSHLHDIDVTQSKETMAMAQVIIVFWVTRIGTRFTGCHLGLRRSLVVLLIDGILSIEIKMTSKAV